MREIPLALPGRDRSYRILIEPGLRSLLGSVLTPLNLAKRVFLVSDRRVARLHGNQVVQALAAGFEPVLLTTPPGERAKTWPVVQRLSRELLDPGAHRGTPHRPGGRRGGGPHRLSGLYLHAGLAFHPGAHHPAGHGGRGHRRQDGHQPAGRQKPSGHLSTNRGWWPSPRNFWKPCPGPSSSTAWRKSSRPPLSGTPIW